MESFPSLLERTVDSDLLLLSSPPSSLSPPTESKFSVDSEKSSCIALSNSKSCSSSVTNDDGSSAETRAHLLRMIAAVALCHEMKLKNSKSCSSSVTDDDGSAAETRAHPLRMIAAIALCHEMKLKVVRKSRSKKFWRSETGKPIYSRKPTDFPSERASETTLSCESCSSRAVSSTRSGGGGGGGWREEEELSLAHSKQKLPVIAKSALMRGRAEAISITWLFFSGCTPTSEVRISQLVGDSPDTSKALWMLLKWEEVKRSSADGRGDPYLYTMRNRLRIDTLDIGYIRDLFPETNFNDQPDPALDIKIKKLMPMDAELQRLIDWIEKLLKKNKDPTEDERQLGSVKDWISCYHLDNFHAGVLSISPYLFVVIAAYLFDLFYFSGFGAPSTRPSLGIDETSAMLSPEWPALVTKHRDRQEFECYHPRTGASSKMAFPHYTHAVIRASSINGWLLLTGDGQGVDGERRRVDYYNINTTEFLSLPSVDVRAGPYGLFSEPRSATLFAQLLGDGTLNAYTHNFGDEGWGEVNAATVTHADSIIIGGLALWNKAIIWFDTDREIHHYSIEDGQYRHARFIDELDGMNGHGILASSILFGNEATYLLVIGMEVKIYTVRAEDTIITQRMASLGARCFYAVGSDFGYSLRAEGVWEEGKILLSPTDRLCAGHCDLYDTHGEHPHVPSHIRDCPEDNDLCACKSAWIRLST